MIDTAIIKNKLGTICTRGRTSTNREVITIIKTITLIITAVDTPATTKVKTTLKTKGTSSTSTTPEITLTKIMILKTKVHFKMDTADKTIIRRANREIQTTKGHLWRVGSRSTITMPVNT